MIFPHTTLDLSGDRFVVNYRLVAGDMAAAITKANSICVEQTVETPPGLLADDDIRASVLGRLEALEPTAGGTFQAAISYAVETAGDELTQLLNVIFGNSSMQPGIRVENLSLPDRMLRQYTGPRFGRAGIRHLLGEAKRPLLCSALKPMGLSASALAGLARQLALGGIDVIKDDHGLANQTFAPFQERVQRCAAAVREANVQSGYRSIYVPNVTGPAGQIVANAYAAQEIGAGGVMIAPGLVGFDTIRQLAEDTSFALPIFSHPAWLGTYAVHAHHGVAHRVLYGQLPRLAGADASIYVNYGGRFSFTEQDCQQIVAGTSMLMGHLRTIFPTPGGGMSLARLPEMIAFYGRDVILLIAGGLYGHGPNLSDSCREFRRFAEEASSEADTDRSYQSRIQEN